MKRVRMPSVTYIVARSHPEKIIGLNNEMPWHQSSDLKFFKKKTSGNAIIMGRKTLESIGKPLPGRYNIVVSRTEQEPLENVKWAKNIESALFYADVHSIINNNKELFVIGGSQIYRQFLSIYNKIFLTTIYTGNIEGDAWFDPDFPVPEWHTKAEYELPKGVKDDHPFRISVYSRRKPIHRRRLAQKLTEHDSDLRAKLDVYDSMVAKSLDNLSADTMDVEQLQLDFK